MIDILRHNSPLFANAMTMRPRSAKDLFVREIGITRAKELNALWHSVLPVITMAFMYNTKICFSAEYDNISYAVAIFTSPIAANRLSDGWNALELRRFAIAPDAPKNTASRVLSIMANIIKCRFEFLTRLISYQSIEHHQGIIYKASGWRAVNINTSREWHHNKHDYRVIKNQTVRWEYKLRDKQATIGAHPNSEGATPIVPLQDLFTKVAAE